MLNRPNLKYSNYFTDEPSAAAPSKNSIIAENAVVAGYVSLGLCIVPWLGILGVVAAIGTGLTAYILDKRPAGLVVAICGPIVFSISLAVWILVIAPAFLESATDSQIRSFTKAMKEIQPSAVPSLNR